MEPHIAMCGSHTTTVSHMLRPLHAQTPDAAGLQRLVAPVGASLQAAQALTEGRRGPAFNHYKAAADALQSLSWVVYTGPNCGAPADSG